MNNVERNHVVNILFAFLKGLFNKVILFIFIFKFLHDVFSLGHVILIISVGIFLFWGSCILNWYKTVFYFKERSIYYQTGVWNIKNREIPFDKVNTVDISEGILDKLLNLSHIKIDTGSVHTDESEISILLNKHRAIEIKNRILNRTNEDIEEIPYKAYRVSMKDLFTYAIVSNPIFNGMGIVFVGYKFLDEYVMKIFFNETKNIKPTWDYSFYEYIWIIMGVIIFCIFISMIHSFIKYYHFKVYTEKDKLNVSYGLFSKKKYAFDRKKIKGIYMKQNIIMQLFHISTIEIESIGYGDEKGEKAILYPVCSKMLQNVLIKELLPEFVFCGNIQKPPKRAAISFLLKKLISIFMVVGILSYYFQYGYMSIVLVPFVAYLGYMEYKNTKAGMDEKLLYMSYNGFNKNESIIKMTAVQSLEISYNCFQKRKGICNYTIHIFSNQFGKSMKVRNLESMCFEGF